MLGFDKNTALESHKQTIMTKAATQSAYGIGNADSISSFVSIFGHQIRQNIQHEADRCDGISSELLTTKLDENVEKLCNGVNQHVSDLQATISWAEDAGKEIISMPQLSASARSQAAQAMKETLSFGQETVVNTVNGINEAMTRLKTVEAENTEKGTTTPTHERAAESIQKTWRTLDETTQEVIKVKAFDESELVEDNFKRIPVEPGENKEIKNAKLKDIPEQAPEMGETARNIFENRSQTTHQANPELELLAEQQNEPPAVKAEELKTDIPKVVPQETTVNIDKTIEQVASRVPETKVNTAPVNLKK